MIFLIIIDLIKLFSIKRKINFVFFIILSFLVGISQMISVGAIMPLVSIYLDPNYIENYTLVSKFISVYANGLHPQFVLTFLFIFFLIFSSILKIFLIYYQSFFAQSVGIDVNKNVMTKILNQSYEEFVKNEYSFYISNLTSKSNLLINNILIQITNLISSFFVFVFFIILLCFVDFFSTLIISSILFISYFLIILKLKKEVKFISDDINFFNNSIVKSIYDALQEFTDIIFYKSHNYFIEAFHKRDFKLRQSNAKIIFFQNLPKVIIETIAISSIIIMMYFSLKIYENKIQDFIPFFSLLIFSSLRLLPSAQQIYSCLISIKGAKSSFNEIVEILNSQNANAPKENNEIFFFNKKIFFHNVSFKYANTRKYIFKNINFEINQGDKIAIVGSNGSGKSTLVELILGLRFPSNGKILIDNTILKKSNIQSWHNNISYIPQNKKISEFKIYESISLGQTELLKDKTKIYNLAKELDLDPNIKNFNFFKEFINRDINSLSGGQVQKISIIRALLRNRKFIVLDESTSAIDNQSEKKIIEYLSKNKNLTLVVVTHNQNFLKKFNKIFKVSNSNLNIINNLK